MTVPIEWELSVQLAWPVVESILVSMLPALGHGTRSMLREFVALFNREIAELRDDDISSSLNQV
jgi:hypothetical protein